MPPIAGAVNWSKGLYERIKEPFDRLETLSASIKEREEYKDVSKLYTSLVRNLNEFNEIKFAQWVEGVEKNTASQLDKFLLVREETDLAEEGFVRVNFDPILRALLREVKYLLLLDLDVPETAEALYCRVDVYRQQTGNLELIVEMYNDMLATLLHVEKPLLADRIEKMGNALEDGISKLRWNSDEKEKNTFISHAMKIVTEVDVLVKKMKDNVSKMQ
jgi:dynein heavy chain